jgi:DNA topoisomerase-2
MNDSDKYEKMDSITHMHRRPDMYVGSTTEIQNSIGVEWVLDDIQQDSLVFSYIEGHRYIPALFRIFIEAVSNSVDNVWRSREKGIVCKRLEITIDETTNEFSVLNDGLVIPFMDYYKDTKIRIPELIFGHLMTSTNYNDKEQRFTSGRNGLGINCTNIFSKKFSVEIFDSKLEKMYTQTWRNHMRQCEEPKIKSKKGKDSYVKVKWIPDLTLFGCITRIPPTMMKMFYKYCVDISAITRIPVKMNSKKIIVKQFIDYVRMYPNINEHIILSKTPDMEIILTNASRLGYQEIVFTNGIHNRSGGTYVDTIMNEILRQVKISLTSKKQSCSITNRELKEYFQIFVNAKLENPEFNNQSKERVIGPNIKNFSVDSKMISQIMKWSWREELRNVLEKKDLKQMKKSEKRKVRIDGYDPANLAGTKHSQKCTLILCEGLSAKTFAVTGIETGWDNVKGRDYYGIMALRGKVLNVRNASLQSIAGNREITNILQALNLKYKMDYSKDENFKQLDYGKVLILTDSDNDGTHIASLLLNYFDVLFPSLLKREFLYIMKTPIAKADKQLFYNEYQYHKFLESIQGTKKKYQIKYYKGLGTSNTQEIKDTFGKKVLRFMEDTDSSKTLNMVFHSKLSNERKIWIENFNPQFYTDFDSEYPISVFINQELIRFSIDDCRRNLPNLYDGLKTSQRKILYAIFKRRLTESMKVAQLSGYVAEVSNYHHGEQCLLETIIRMAQSFVGSNNLPLLYPDGQFGSRLENGRDSASGRYIFTKLQSYTRILFPEIDDKMLHYIYDDNDKVEPEYYLPILPMVMINGVSTAIGTGFSCSIPPYHIKEIMACVLSWIDSIESNKNWNDSMVDELTPYYNHYKGTITKIEEGKFRSCGIFEILNNDKYRITELAIGYSINKYKEFLEELLENKKIKNLKNYSTASQVHFEFTILQGFVPTYESLKLTSLIHLSNMVVFEKDFKLKKFTRLSDIFTSYCETRYQGYIVQKELIIENLKKDLVVLLQKQKFLELILTKKLDLSKYADGDLIDKLENLFQLKKIEGSFQYLLTIPIHHMTKTQLLQLASKIEYIQKEILRVQKLSPGEFWKSDIEKLQKIIL